MAAQDGLKLSESTQKREHLAPSPFDWQALSTVLNFFPYTHQKQRERVHLLEYRSIWSVISTDVSPDRQTNMAKNSWDQYPQCFRVCLFAVCVCVYCLFLGHIQRFSGFTRGSVHKIYSWRSQETRWYAGDWNQVRHIQGKCPTHTNMTPAL